jgi:hypothetical protein
MHGGGYAGKIMMMFSEFMSWIDPTATSEATNKETSGCPVGKARWGAGLLMGLLLSSSLQAAELTPSVLVPSQDTTPILTLQTSKRQEQLSLASIERLPLYDATLQHPEGPEGTYSGVRLIDLLSAYDMEEATRLRLTAVDNYSVFLDQKHLEEKDYLVVTRFDDAPVPRSQLGPLMLIVPADEQAVLDGKVPYDKWIWALTRINAS